MKKFKYIGVVATIAVLGLVVVIGGYIYTNTDNYQAEQLYKALSNDYTIAQCDSIIIKYPNTEWADSARQKKNILVRQQNEWNSITKNPSIQSVKNFKKKHKLTTKYSVAADEKLDSLLWFEACNNKIEKNYKEYIELGQMAHNYNEAMSVLQKMNNLAEVSSVAPTLENNVCKFFEELGNGNAKAVAELCADTVSHFLFRNNFTSKEVAEFITNTYCKNIKKRTFSKPNNMEFNKVRIDNEKVGYSAQFTIELTAPVKVARKHKATIFFTPDSKIIYAKMRHN